MKKGFTLLELMIVIGIIVILAAILLKSVGGATDSARAAKCLSNMHNLASACQSVAMVNSHYPLAGSCEWKDRRSAALTYYHEAKGWISWSSEARYRNNPQSHQSSSGWFMSTYEQTLDKRIYALTNGAIWKAISGNASAFVCPHHKECVQKKKADPVWSYVMNCYFGWDNTLGEGSKLSAYSGAQRFETLDKPDRRLLFAELPFDESNSAQECDFSAGTGIKLDPTLQYGENEVIGFNHKTKKKWYAHICFADGHTEKLQQPADALNTHLQELTQWLCEGQDIGYNGSRYEVQK